MERSIWKILLVDDDEDDYLITQSMLAETQGVKCSLEWASTYETGQQRMFHSSYDAVLMDYDLGVRTGLELIRESAAKGCEYPIILLTGRGSHEVDVEAMQAGATMYLSKSEANPLLLERVIRYAIEIKQKERAIIDREMHIRKASERLEQELAERKKTEKQLRENETWLRLAFDATDMGTWQHDLSTNIFTFDARTRRHYGIEQNELSFEENLALVHPEDLDRVKGEIASTLDPQGTGRYATEFRVVHPDGAVRHIAIQARVYFEGQGVDRRPVLGVGTTQDITERKEAEQAILRQAERQEILLQVTDWILKAGPDRESLTRLIYEKVSQHLNADVCFNYQLDQPEGPLKLVAGIGIPAEMWEDAQQLALGQAFCGTVAATRKPLAADEARIQTDEKGAFVRGMGVRAYACHPLFARSGEVMGTLSLCSTQRSAFTAEEINFLQTLSHFVALAWDRDNP